MRELTTVKIEKISIVGSPANRKPWLMKKSTDGDGQDKDLAEIMAAVTDFLGPDFPAVNALNKDEFLKLIATLKQYQPSFPDDIAEAVSALVSFAASTFSDEDEADDLTKADELDPSDPWASLPLAVPRHLIKKEELEDEEPEEIEKDDEFNYDPVQIRLARIEKKLDGEIEPTDLWPSLDPITPGTKIAVKKSQPTPKVDPDEKQLAISKQVGSDEGSHISDIKKVDDDEDLYPSLSNELFYRP